MTKRTICLTGIIFAAIALAPFCVVQVPGLGDMLNHLARMHVLATIGQSAALQRYYADGPAPDWQCRLVSAYASAHPWESPS